MPTPPSSPLSPPQGARTRAWPASGTRRLREELRDARDRFVASDPGWARLRLGIRALVAVASTTLLMAGLATVLGQPAALVVLLGAVALGRTWFGVVLVFAYGAGMAAMLTLAGLLLIKVRDRLENLAVTTRLRKLADFTPFSTAALVLVVGLAVVLLLFFVGLSNDIGKLS